MRVYTLVNVVIVDSTQINLVIQVIISQKMFTMIACCLITLVLVFASIN